jgi:hypothetical protein
MPFAYFDRLSAARKRVYRQSDAVRSVQLKPGPPFGPMLHEIQAALELEKRTGLQRVCQTFLDQLTARLDVPAVKVRVRSVRPSGRWGELHGLYEPGEDGAQSVISVWMRTVARKQMVAYKTFVRTLIHELCHHLDYELFKLPETFHTEGFYRREASLFRQVHGLPDKQADL